MPSTDTTAKQPKEAPPKCWRKRQNGEGKREQCTNPAYPVWVTGEFGRSPQMLCRRCIAELKAIGWKIHYQLEGDNPPAKEEK